MRRSRARLCSSPVSVGLCLADLRSPYREGTRAKFDHAAGWLSSTGSAFRTRRARSIRDYRGEVSVILINLGNEAVAIDPGHRIAQLVICPVAHAVLSEVEVLDETERGTGGFGHTT